MVTTMSLCGSVILRELRVCIEVLAERGAMHRRRLLRRAPRADARLDARDNSEPRVAAVRRPCPRAVEAKPGDRADRQPDIDGIEMDASDPFIATPTMR
jgi:hypothetical protein